MQRCRKDLEDFLERFVAGHRGLRRGRLFGAPAAYAGPMLFSCAVEDGIAARLPSDACDLALAKGASPWKPRGRAWTGWVIFRPRTARATESLLPFLEIAARHVALDAGRSRS